MHHWILRLFLYITVVSVMTSALAGSPCDKTGQADGRWELSLKTPLATIYHPADGSVSLPAALVRVQWDADPARLYAIIRDYDHFADFIPNVTDSRIVARQADRVWVYQQLHLPGPARDRHYIMVSHNNGTEPGQHDYHVEWELNTKYPLPGNSALVAPRHFRGCWTIRPGQQSGLVAQYWIELDPGGWLPHWVTQAALNQYIDNLMGALNQRVTSSAGIHD